MPRVRSIKPEHWSDKNLTKLSLGAHLLWIGMWNFSDDKGVIEYDCDLIRSNIFPRRKDIKSYKVKKWIEELVQEKFIIPFEHKDIQYLIHRTFDIHQRIDKPQKSKVPDDIIRGIIGERSKNDPRIVEKNSGAFQEDSRLERRGEESIGKERSKEDPFLIYDIEKYLMDHQKDFESICMDAKKPKEHVVLVLKKYHLWNQEKEIYPKKPLPLIAGLKKWLMNEKNVNGINDEKPQRPGTPIEKALSQVKR